MKRCRNRIHSGDRRHPMDLHVLLFLGSGQFKVDVLLTNFHGAIDHPKDMQFLSHYLDIDIPACKGR